MDAGASVTVKNSLGPIMMKALIAGVIAAIVNVVIFFVGRAVVGGIAVDINQVGTYSPMPFFLPIVASLVPMLLAGLGLWVARRFIPRGNLIFVIVAALITLLSLASPYSGQVATTSAATVLMLMHLVVGGIMIGYLAKQ